MPPRNNITGTIWAKQEQNNVHVQVSGHGGMMAGG